MTPRERAVPSPLYLGTNTHASDGVSHARVTQKNRDVGSRRRPPQKPARRTIPADALPTDFDGLLQRLLLP